MKWYPWLNPCYRQIIGQHLSARAHHALLIQAQSGMGDAELIWGISRWLMCHQRNGIKSCGECHGCRLMNAGTHPDWHSLPVDKNTLGIDAVRDVCEKLFQRAQQGGARVVWLPDARKLTAAAANALLKTLEEPPENSWFFLTCRQISPLPATLRSRCQKLHLTPPPQAQGLHWLKKHLNVGDPVLLSALRLSYGAPAAALTFIENDLSARQTLCQELGPALRHDLLRLLPQFNNDDVVRRIGWLSTLLIDAQKWHYRAVDSLTNVDQHELITFLARSLSVTVLDKSLRLWLTCRDRLLHLTSVNRELLLTDQLLAWEALVRADTATYPKERE